MFSDDISDNNNANNNTNNNNENDNPDINNTTIDNNSPNNVNIAESRIVAEAHNQKSLVRAKGKNKSLVPYIGEVLIIPVQKPLFPGFSSILHVKNENLKNYFIKLYRKRLYQKKNENNIDNNTEWIGLFLNNPKKSPVICEEEFNDDNNGDIKDKLMDDHITVEEAIDNEMKQEDPVNESIEFHPLLDEINSNLHHYVEHLPQDIDDVFDIGVLAKIDYNDEQTNINEFIELTNNENNINAKDQTTNANVKHPNKKQSSSNSKAKHFPVTSFEDPMFLKIISARRIKLNSIHIHKPILYANISHLQPDINNDNNTYTVKDLKDTNDEELKTRSGFNIASDILRRLYNDDPDNRHQTMQLWSARDRIDIGFFCDFAGCITNSTPRELQNLLCAIDYGDRLEILIRLLKREENMIKKRDEIIHNVDTMMKKDEESQYLKMILHATQNRLMINTRQRQQIHNAQSTQHQHSQQQHPQPVSDNDKDVPKKDRYQRLAQKYLDRVQDKVLNDEAKEVFDEGIEKLQSAEPHNKSSLDLESTKQYLDWISSLPWNTSTIDNNDINVARNILNNTHYGMKFVKERILEVIASNILKMDNAKDTTTDDDDDVMNESKILCLIGPPGVGKTSIGSSIAQSLNKKFYKFSLGGNDDSHLLKGFLRTYSGSQPGKIVYGLKQCGSNNPVVLIDEIDKLGARHSDPSHSLLEILDPSQNNIFNDNYLDFSVDLSNILFVCTANDETKINPILRDRLNIIYLNGYDENEKLEIAKNYLIPIQLKKSGLKKENININDNVINELIKWYSRESGVRSLSQNIERIFSKSALQLVESNNYNIVNDKEEPQQELIMDDKDKNIDNHRIKILDTLSNFVKKIAKDNNNNKSDELEQEAINNNMDDNDNSHSVPFISITLDNLTNYVGLRKYCNERTYDDDKLVPYGVVTGLGYTTAGGCITYIETVKYKKNNDNNSNNGSSGTQTPIKITGYLGKVMNESVEIAQSVVRSILLRQVNDGNSKYVIRNGSLYNKFFDEYNIHLHCPEGGISKDGPSAGITMCTALLSLALNCSISSSVAMTGEITLNGKILKIGGLKEKLLAAKRSSINTLILPYDNYDDFHDNEFGIPKYLKNYFKDVHFVKCYDEVLQILFDEYLIKNNDNNNDDIDDIHFKQQEQHDNDDNNNENDYLNKAVAMPKPI